MRQREITNEQLLTAVTNVFVEERDRMRKAFEAERRELLRQLLVELKAELRALADALVEERAAALMKERAAGVLSKSLGNFEPSR